MGSSRDHLDDFMVAAPAAPLLANPPTPSAETVNHPQHYGGDGAYECIRVIQAWGVSFEIGSVLKYVCRAGKKPGAKRLEDLRKAKRYIEFEIERVENEEKGHE